MKTNSTIVRKLTLWCLLGPVLLVRGAEPSRIRIEDTASLKNAPVPIALIGYSGEVARTLEFDLYVAGFKSVPEARASYVLKGGNAGRVEGRLRRAGDEASLLAKAYSGGTLRAQAHALSDDIVKAVRGHPGVARGKIAFKVRRGTSGGTGEIYVADYDGHNAVAVTSDRTYVGTPKWVPGRQMLVYMTYKMGDADIFSHDLVTGARHAVARYSGTDMSPAVSPDGRRVALILSKSGSPNLFVANLDGAGLRQLTFDREVKESPCWSPDGGTICYSTVMGGGRVLATIPANGGTPRRFPMRGAANPSEPDWASDGKTIAFTSQTRSGFTVCVAPAAGGDAEVLVSGEDPAWAANSRTIIYTRRLGSGGRVLSLLDVPTKQHKDLPRTVGNSSQPSWAR